MQKSGQLAKATEIIRDLIKYGDHPGKCTNVLKNGDRDHSKSCTKHLAANKRRERAAVKFLSSVTGI